MIPVRGVAEIGRLHRAVVVVAAVGLGIAVVKAAAVVVVVPADHPILALRLIVHRCSLRIVLAQSHAGRNEHPVYLVPHDRHRRHVRQRKMVEAAHRRTAESAARCLDQMVVLGRLIVNDRDPAVGVCAECVLSRRVRVSAGVHGGGLNHADVESLAVRLAQNLIERTIVSRIESARGAVRRGARRASGGIEVTRAFGSGRDVSGLRGHGERGGRKQQRGKAQIHGALNDSTRRSGEPSVLSAL